MFEGPSHRRAGRNGVSPVPGMGNGTPFLGCPVLGRETWAPGGVRLALLSLGPFPRRQWELGWFWG